MKDDCNFVIRNLRSHKYNTVSREQDLPANKEGYKIWQKEEVPVKGRRNYSLKNLKIVTNLIYLDCIHTILAKPENDEKYGRQTSRSHENGTSLCRQILKKVRLERTLTGTF